jgi:predicted nucleic acid-binding protein
VDLSFADDDHVVAAAVTAQADFLISGNTRNFNPLPTYNGITVLTVRQVLEKIN